MSHCFYDGTIYHKRFTPKIHTFVYPFFFLNIDISKINTLHNRLFGYERFNLFSFYAKDHFGKKEESFETSVASLLDYFELGNHQNIHFLTLPRIGNFVFNPISVVVLLDEKKPTTLLVEVHNYNNGRVVYLVRLKEIEIGQYEGESQKTMYVSPFFDTEGKYHFVFEYSDTRLILKVDLYTSEKRVFSTSFVGVKKTFDTKTIFRLFGKHSFLGVWVVTRTLWQSLKLYLKGLKWHSPREIDKKRRF